MMKNFIETIEYIYETLDIYRAIIIANNDNELNELFISLRNKDHNPIIVNRNSQIDYNYRLFLIKDINLINFFNKKKYNHIFIY